VTADLDTLLIALYVLIDDHVIPPTRRRPGRPKRLSDAELVCLAVAQVLLGARSEHHWLRLCYGRLGHLFPYMPVPLENRVSGVDLRFCALPVARWEAGWPAWSYRSDTWSCVRCCS
jgi:hypothetical protein